MDAPDTQEAFLHRLWEIRGEVNCWKNNPNVEITAASGCLELMRASKQLFETGMEVISHIELQPAERHAELTTSLAFVYGCTYYQEIGLLVRYHGDMTDFARQHPALLKQILGFADRHKENDRLGGKTSLREVIYSLSPDDPKPGLLGSLFAQPAKTVAGVRFWELAAHLPLVDEYVKLAGEVDPTGLKVVRSLIAKKMARRLPNLSLEGQRGMDLRRHLFDGQVICAEESSIRIQQCADILYGDKMDESLVALARHLEVLAHDKRGLEGVFGEMTGRIESRESRLFKQEEFIAVAAIEIQKQHCAVLCNFLSQHGIDHRIALKPWLLGSKLKSRYSASREDDEHWFDSEIICRATILGRGATLDRLGQRLMAWISTFSEARCLAACKDEDQLMTCFRATGHSRIIHRISKESHLEEILLADLGL